MQNLQEKPDRNPVDRRRSLASIPILNPGVRLEPEADGRMLVVVPVARSRKGWLARFQPRVIERKVRLDSLGAFVLNQVDGRRTVRLIVDAFVETYRTTHREAELSTADFLKSLAQRNIISIGVQ